MLQVAGAEVILLGHNRSVDEVVTTAIQEDVQGIAVSSYQGGHMEYFKYLYDSLQERGASHIQIFGGGGGVIIPPEIKELEEYGIRRIYSPEDGRKLGLQGMINEMVQLCDFPLNGENQHLNIVDLEKRNTNTIARLITLAEKRAFQEEVSPEVSEFFEREFSDEKLPSTP